MSFLSQIISKIVTPFRIVSSWVTKLIPGFRRLTQLSLAARIAWMTFLFLLIVLGAGVVKYMLMDNDVRDVRDWGMYCAIGIGAAIPISIAMYWLIRLLQEKPNSQMPDLDRAWRIGIEALEAHAIPLRKVPLFLVIGSEKSSHVRHLMEAVQFDAVVAPPENEDLPLLWYGNHEAIFLFMPGSSCLSAVSRSRGKASFANRESAPQPAHADAGRTLSDEAVPPGHHAAASNVARKTLGGSGGLAGPLTPPSPLAAPAAMVARGTLGADSPAAVADADRSQSAATIAPSAVNKLGEDELDLHARRLRHVCTLLRSARRPVCPMNGLLVVTPFDLIETGSTHPRIALQNDLHIVREHLVVRCPVILLVAEMERMDGFLEFVKRHGVDLARESRIGKGCDAWSDATMQRLDAVAAHAVGAFEDLIYKQFQSPDSLRRPYNGKLVALLCRTRGAFSEALRGFVRSSFGYDPKKMPELADTQLLFTGCYFAATGKDDDHRAFVNAVFAKLIENQAELEWAPRARREDATLHNWANIFSLLGMIAVAAIIIGTLMLVFDLQGGNRQS